MMRSLLAILAIATVATAFSPSASRVHSVSSTSSSSRAAPLNMVFGGDGEEPKKLTRENEPDEFFSTNTDKMSDEEKIPIAIAGLVGISLPFIAGLIALYAAK
mmetsp:Transcript_29487/g.50197  ORF Transcript_29487/g.50197 Transcript_29487/m.50197 type:complete len:103 (-) Transcript_29487:354-662(-)